MTRGLHVVIGIFLALPVAAFETKTIPSPDHAFLAVVSSSVSAHSSEVSSFIVMKASSGVAMNAQAYRTSDDPHGGRISSAAWTDDSRFFVYMLENLKGPSPLTHPIFFWDSHDNQLYSLDKQFGGITAGFALNSPDIIQARAKEDFSVSLSSAAFHFLRAEKDKCEFGGGKIRLVGRRANPVCVTPYHDAGRKCTDSAQCKGGCYLDGGKEAPPEGTKTNGVCRRDNRPTGCFIEIIHGKTQPGVCAD